MIPAIITALLPTAVGFIKEQINGRAAKAGAAAIAGAIGAPGAIAGVETFMGSDLGLTIIGYILIGALQGGIQWATVYFRVNKGSVDGVFPKAPDGLY